MSTNGIYEGNGAHSAQWWPSRYGVDDVHGAGNELTPERLLAALRIPTQGKVIQIAQLLEPGTPAFPPRGFQQWILTHYALESHAESDWTGIEEQITTGLHLGCHLDGLAHIGVDGRVYNGTPLTDILDPAGLKKFGIESVLPWVTRGVLLDVSAVVGGRLPGGFVITPEHLEAAQQRQGVEVAAGDAVLIHTGWASGWMTDPGYGDQEPGIGWDAAHWLTERRPSVVAADNWALEVIPFEQPGREYVVHQHLLTETGTFIIENVRLDELVEGGHDEFLFIMLPNKIKGATASHVAPICVV